MPTVNCAFENKFFIKFYFQEALISRKPEFVSALRQRQKRLYLAAEHRRLQALVRAEQEMIFLNHRKTVANPEAHPYGGNCCESECKQCGLQIIMGFIISITYCSQF